MGPLRGPGYARSDVRLSGAPPAGENATDQQQAPRSGSSSGSPTKQGRKPTRGPAARFESGTLGPTLLSASVGVQLTLAAVLSLKPEVQDTGRLTQFGLKHFHPEQDSLLYLGSIGVAMIVQVAWIVAFKRRDATGSTLPAKSLRRLLVFQLAVAVGGLVLSVGRFLEARRYLIRGLDVPSSYFAVAAALLAVSIGSVFLHSGRRGRTGGDDANSDAAACPALSAPALRFSLLDPVVPLVLAATIYVPGWRLLAGRFLFEENLGHWDYFIMAPALAFRHGLELGSDVSTMYGIGWPMFFSGLYAWTAPSFGRMIQFGTIYSCVYLFGIYLLLRVLVGRPALAALGTALAATHVFLGMGESVIWRFPSMTVMRSAFDVWCLVALTMHWRSKRRIWVAVAGLCLGLAVVFGTDTGLSLAVACGFYWLGLLRSASGRAEARARATDVLVFGATALAALLAFLLLGARGTIFAASFWRGWLESLLEFREGFIGVPLSTGPNTATLVTFVVVFLTYLAFFGDALGRMVEGRIRQVDAFHGLLALYGLLEMLQFLGKSDRFQYRLGIPLVVIVVNLAGRWLGAAFGEERLTPRWMAPALAAALASGILLLPASALVEPIRSYPNSAAALVTGRQGEGDCLILEPRDICGLPPGLKLPAEEFRRATQQVSDLTDSGATVAVIGETGSFPYLGTNSAPWGRYPRMFVSVFTKDKLAELGDRLEEDSPDYVFLRIAADSEMLRDSGEPGRVKTDYSRKDYDELYRAVLFGVGPTPDSPYSDTWNELISTVHKRYRLQQTSGPYEIWKLNAATN